MYWHERERLWGRETHRLKRYHTVNQQIKVALWNKICNNNINVLQVNEKYSSYKNNEIIFYFTENGFFIHIFIFKTFGNTMYSFVHTGFTNFHRLWKVCDSCMNRAYAECLSLLSWTVIALSFFKHKSPRITSTNRFNVHWWS